MPSERAPIVLVVAHAENRGIGLRGELPWRIPEDLRHFKRLTLGHPVVMGRRTFDSVGRPLPGRTNIVVSRSLDAPPAGCLLAGSLEEALRLAGDAPQPDDREPAICVVGGGQIYAEALPRADRIERTVVHAAPEADAFFPEFDESAWDVTTLGEGVTEAGLRYTFQTLRRRAR